MSLNLRLSLIIVSIVLFIVVIHLYRRNRLPFKYTLVWFFPACVTLVIGAIPQILLFVKDLVGFISLANMVSGLLILLLIFVCISLSVIVSTQKKELIMLVQEVSILKAKIGVNNEKN